MTKNCLSGKKTKRGKFGKRPYFSPFLVHPSIIVSKNSNKIVCFYNWTDITQVGEGARDGAGSKTPPTTPSKAAAKGKLLGVKVLIFLHIRFYIVKVAIFPNFSAYTLFLLFSRCSCSTTLSHSSKSRSGDPLTLYLIPWSENLVNDQKILL